MLISPQPIAKFACRIRPRPQTSQLAGWFTAAMLVPEGEAKLVTQNLYPVGTCGADLGAVLSKKYVEYGRIIAEANIKAE